MTTATNKILDAKAANGSDAYLWLHTSGDCILWPSEAASVDDDGRKAIGRWSLDKTEIAELIDSGECDDIA